MPGTKVNKGRFDPYRNFKFRIKLDGKYVAGAIKIVPKAKVEDLNLAGSVKTIFGQLLRKRARPKARSPKSGRGAASLFAGMPGAGKSMAAEAIANQLGNDLFRIDLSQVVSKYIGETEKNLARLFAAAEDAGAVLFFEEADALFGKRTEVGDSRDRYANNEIAYLLQRLEDYPGIAILATNRKKDIDSAFLRRLQFIVEFPPPRPQANKPVKNKATRSR